MTEYATSTFNSAACLETYTSEVAMPDIQGLCVLLERHSAEPCVQVAEKFRPATASDDERTTLVKNGLVPLLSNCSFAAHLRILAAYLVHALYDYPNHLNPYRQHLIQIFEVERKTCLDELSVGFAAPGKAQLVYCLWRILMGSASSLSQYSSKELSQIQLASQNQPSNLPVCLSDEARPDTQRPISHSPLHHHSPSTSSSQMDLSHPDSSPHSRTSTSISYRTPSESSFSHNIAFVETDDARRRFAEEEMMRRQYTEFDALAHSRNSSQSSSHVPIPGPFFQKPELPMENNIHHHGTDRIRPAERAIASTFQGPGSRNQLVYSSPDAYGSPLASGSSAVPQRRGRQSPTRHWSPQASSLSARSSPTRVGFDPRSAWNANAHIVDCNTPNAPADLYMRTNPTIPQILPRLQHTPDAGPQQLRQTLYGDRHSAPATQENFHVADVPSHHTQIHHHTSPFQLAPQMQSNNYFPNPSIASSSVSHRSPGVIGSGRPRASPSRNATTNAPTSTTHSDNRQDHHLFTVFPPDQRGGNSHILLSQELEGLTVGGITHQSHATQNAFEASPPYGQPRQHQSQSQGGFGQPPELQPFMLRPQVEASPLGRPLSRQVSEMIANLTYPGSTPGVSHTDRLQNLHQGLSFDDTVIDALSQDTAERLNISRAHSHGSHRADRGVGNPADNGPAAVWPPQLSPSPSFDSRGSESFSGPSPSIGTNHSSSHPGRFNTSYAAPIAGQDRSRPPSGEAQGMQSVQVGFADMNQQQQQHNQQPPSISTEMVERRLSETPRPSKERQDFTRAIKLFIDARDRVLTLAERRVLQPHLAAMTQPLCFLQPDDIASLVAKNPDVATKLLIMLLERDDAEGEGGTDVGEMRNVIPNESMFAEELANIMKQTTNGNPPSIPTNMASLPRKADYLAALTRLPPMRQSFEVIGGLLRPHHHPRSREADRNTDSSEERVACLIRMEVLGEFVAGCVRWIEQAEREEMQGEVCDDRVAIATGNLCRFYSSLLHNGFLSIDSEVDTAEMATFSLQFSRYEEARKLYSFLAEARA